MLELNPCPGVVSGENSNAVVDSVRVGPYIILSISNAFKMLSDN
ncbi:hypothetical protein AAJ76_1020009545 [Vairimorpha ceranae]|uniref:Uncharacterized protein n=1 Tax=Vairimorpha ceranae TaxID=40302 RepID=A0A0F9W931_9MICR|nr:hypothetical protein AAJ76_1020009545 [Vairimorpha ceranae]KKO74201.1 hypothetical protein AAJ76_1020009545 [Vairimorpha ceranae]